MAEKPILIWLQDDRDPKKQRLHHLVHAESISEFMSHINWEDSKSNLTKLGYECTRDESIHTSYLSIKQEWLLTTIGIEALTPNGYFIQEQPDAKAEE